LGEKLENNEFYLEPNKSWLLAFLFLGERGVAVTGGSF
jgi:hypothetical protein